MPNDPKLSPSETDMNALAHYLRDAKNRRDADETNAPKTTFLIGAGCSISSGYPTGQKLIDTIWDDNPNHPELASLAESDRNNYQLVTNAVPKARFRRALDISTQSPESSLSKCAPSWGYVILADFLRTGLIDKVLSFNFDNLVSEAAAIIGYNIVTYDLTGEHRGTNIKFSRGSVIHLHGQIHGPELYNTEDDTDKVREKVDYAFSNSMSDGDLWVMGYSGVSDPHFAKIEKNFHGENTLNWFGHSQSAPNPDSNLWTIRNANFYGGCDFDRTMISLAKKLDQWPPEAFANPLSIISEGLKKIQKFPKMQSDNSRKYIELNNHLVQVLEPDIHRYKSKVTQLFKDAEGDDIDALKLKEKAIREWESGNYIEANNLFLRSTSINPYDDDAFSHWGANFMDEVETVKEEKRMPLIVEAEDKCKEAIKRNPGNHHPYSVLGNALFHKALLKDDSSSYSLFSEAGEYYKKSIDIKEDFSDGYYNWGNSVWHQSGYTNPVKKLKLLRSAISLHEKAGSFADHIYIRSLISRIVIFREISIFSKGKEKKNSDVALQSMMKEVEFLIDGSGNTEIAWNDSLVYLSNSIAGRRKKFILSLVEMNAFG